MSVTCITTYRPPKLMTDTVFAAAAQLESEGDPTAAALIYKEYADSDERAALNLGTIWYGYQWWSRAAVLYRRATRLNQDYPVAWFNLGNALDEMMQPAKAIEAYEKALQLCPNYPDCLFNLAMVLCQAGHRRRSIKYWAAYVKLDRTGLHADIARAKIKQILKQDVLSASTHRKTACL